MELKIQMGNYHASNSHSRDSGVNLKRNRLLSFCPAVTCTYLNVSGADCI